LHPHLLQQKSKKLRRTLERINAKTIQNLMHYIQDYRPTRKQFCYLSVAWLFLSISHLNLCNIFFLLLFDTGNNQHQSFFFLVKFRLEIHYNKKTHKFDLLDINLVLKSVIDR
jgi:hypothetical protein